MTLLCLIKRILSLLGLSKKTKHWAMVAGFAAIAYVENTHTAWAAFSINLIWLLEE